MKYATLLAVALALQAAMGSVQAAAGAERIVAAREALRTGNRSQLDALAAQASNHVLDSYVEYWRLSNIMARPDPLPEGEIEAFLGRHEGSVLGEQLRAAWIRRMAKQGDWLGVTTLYPALLAPERDLTCHALNARLQGGDRGALDEAMAVWQREGALIEACQPVVGALVIADRIQAEELWMRLRVAIDNRRATEARLLVSWLGPAQAPAAADVERLLANPRSFLERLPLNFSISRKGRELAMAALMRVARESAGDAHARFERLFDRFKGEERAVIYAGLGWRAAEQHLPQALEWYRAAGAVPMLAEQHAWHVRAALRAKRWADVQRAIERMPAEQQGKSSWVYWLGRAQQATGDETGGAYQYARIADGSDFYGLLAAEELGRPFSRPAVMDAAQPGGEPEILDAGLQRALALFALDMRHEATREWNWALRGRDDSFLLAAAALAARHSLYDRAINTAELARDMPMFDLRYLAPYRQLIEPQARAQGLDLSWVYGVMRQESRFVPSARSTAGAQGLMQVMPATGRWVARKVGASNYSLAWLREPENNVRIGTSYMRLILEDLDNQPVLASAGYNAGPGRARRWRDGQPLEGAIYAETIPFEETRDYVKKVMANAVIYGALFEDRPQSLKQRLGTVGATQ